jgi:hypothetical protein
MKNRQLLTTLLGAALAATIALGADQRNKTGQNSNQPSNGSQTQTPAMVGSQGSPAPRTGYHDPSTNTPGDYVGNHASYPQPQRVYDGKGSKTTPATPVAPSASTPSARRAN